jgi:hypothetical protein
MMDHDRWVRRALTFSVFYNLAGAILFAFPSSALGQLAGLPHPVPAFYCAFVALFVSLFAGAYAWLAVQPEIDRPLVAFAAIGKTGAFAAIVAFWLLGDLPGRGVLTATGDLALAGIFAWWLVFTREADSHAPRTAAVAHSR